MRPSKARQRGFTILEVAVVTSILAIIGSAAIQIFGANQDLVADTRAHQRAESVHRQNMTKLSRVLRGVDIQTLGGFDEEGRAVQPAFARVTGADLDDITYAGSESLRWIQAPGAVDGIERPGAVYLVRGAGRHLVAERIPEGGFHVRQQGQSLVIHLRTYYVTSARHVVTKTSETAVSIRN